MFLVAGYLPVWTKNAAAALTWVVYARLVKSIIGTVGALLIGWLVYRWTIMQGKWTFLLGAGVYSAAAAYILSGLGDSVNEYVHFPEYAALTVLWYVTFRRMRTAHDKRRTAGLATVLSVLTGVLEESAQAVIPLRVFDPRDILLNVMGVFLGLLLVWAYEAPRAADKVQGPARD